MGNVFPANLHMQIRSGSFINKSIWPNEFLVWNSNIANCNPRLLGRIQGVPHF